MFLLISCLGLIGQYSGSGYFKIASNSVELQPPPTRFPVTGGKSQKSPLVIKVNVFAKLLEYNWLNANIPLLITYV